MHSKMPDTRDELIAEYVRASFAYEEACRAFHAIPLTEFADIGPLSSASQHLQNVRAELRHRYPDEEW